MRFICTDRNFGLGEHSSNVSKSDFVRVLASLHMMHFLGMGNMHSCWFFSGQDFVSPNNFELWGLIFKSSGTKPVDRSPPLICFPCTNVAILFAEFLSMFMLEWLSSVINRYASSDSCWHWAL